MLIDAAMLSFNHKPKDLPLKKKYPQLSQLSQKIVDVKSITQERNWLGE